MNEWKEINWRRKQGRHVTLAAKRQPLNKLAAFILDGVIALSLHAESPKWMMGAST